MKDFGALRVTVNLLSSTRSTMAMVRLPAMNPAQKLTYLSFTSAEGKGAPLPFWGPSQSFDFSLFPLPMSGDLRSLSTNICLSPLWPTFFLNGHLFDGLILSIQREDNINSLTSSSPWAITWHLLLVIYTVSQIIYSRWTWFFKLKFMYHCLGSSNLVLFECCALWVQVYVHSRTEISSINLYYDFYIHLIRNHIHFIPKTENIPFKNSTYFLFRAFINGKLLLMHTHTHTRIYI